MQETGKPIVKKFKCLFQILESMTQNLDYEISIKLYGEGRKDKTFSESKNKTLVSFALECKLSLYTLTYSASPLHCPLVGEIVE